MLFMPPLMVRSAFNSVAHYSNICYYNKLIVVADVTVMWPTELKALPPLKEAYVAAECAV